MSSCLMLEVAMQLLDLPCLGLGHPVMDRVTGAGAGADTDVSKSSSAFTS